MKIKGDSRWFKIFVIAFLNIVFLGSIASGQYFGRNKVQYEDFDFRIYETPNFKVYHYPQMAEAAEDAALMAERWYRRQSEFFQYDIEQKQPMILYANHADFQQTNVIFGLISQGVGGVTEGMKQRIVLPLTGVYAENDHVIGHELVHGFQYDMVMGSGRGRTKMAQMPLLFVEGIAEYLTIGRIDPFTSMWLRDAVLNDDVPTIETMAYEPRYFPYRFGHAFWAFIAGQYSDKAASDLYSTMVAAGWTKGIERILNSTHEELSEEWQNAIRNHYEPQLEGRVSPADFGEPIVEGGGGMNLSPSISPDGKYIAFLSRRDLFTIDLYLANAQTGEVLSKLVSSASDAHFDALRFTNSSGSWSPDGSQFAFVVFDNGDNEIAIMKVEDRGIEEKIKIDGVDAIRDLAWSPDGNRIAFSGTSGGIGDLYIHDLAENNTTKITDDLFTQIQPDWSPDGSMIACATDRGDNSDLSDLKFPSMNIALYDLNNNSVEVIKVTSRARHINPHFSPDGNDLYMIANPDGYSNLYRYSRTEKSFYKVTNFATGISGLTENSGALTLADDAGRLAFTVFDNRDYKIYALNIDQAGGSLYQDRGSYEDNSFLPPAGEETFVSSYLDIDKIRLEPGKFTTTDYSANLDLIYAGRPTIGISVDRFGTSLGGGVNLLYSDMLGNHLLSVVALINGGLKDLGGQVAYQYRGNRINYGAMAGHIPYLTARLRSDLDTVVVEGDSVVATEFEFIRERVFSEQVALMAEYPFSTNRRLEATAGYTHMSFNREADRVLTFAGVVLDQSEEDLPDPSSLNLFQSSLAYVGDYSFFGFTSPVRGSRFRFEAQPTLGSLTYLSVLADYRQYFFINPITLAFRAYHHGRYLEDSESDRLSQLFIGFETLVRGYSIGSFDVAECTQTSSDGRCAEIDRLIGSRLAVFNAELRLPLFGTREYGLVNFPTLPTELSFFFDGGVAWNKGDSPELKWDKNTTERIPVFSAGVSARINLFGYLVTQFYLAFPFQRPTTDTEFGFVIAPGW